MGANLRVSLHDEAQAMIDGWDWKQRVACLGHTMSGMPQTECPLNHHFAPGMYVREIVMPANTYIIGKIHKTEHFNILTKGSCMLISENGEQEILEAGAIFVSKAGVQKVLYIIEETTWLTVHASEETDIARLEESLAEPLPDDPMKDVMQLLEKSV